MRLLPEPRVSCDSLRMLQAFVTPGPRMLGLHGLDAASASIKALQQALAAYAAATNYPAANPGAIDGFLGAMTRAAVLAVVPRLPKLPSAVKSILQYGAVAAVIPEVAQQIDSLITTYAAEITTAIKLLQIAQTPSPPATPTGAGTTATTTTPSTTGPSTTAPGSGVPGAAPSWYKTGPGMAAIGVGATAVLTSAILLATK